MQHIEHRAEYVPGLKQDKVSTGEWAADLTESTEKRRADKLKLMYFEGRETGCAFFG